MIGCLVVFFLVSIRVAESGIRKSRDGMNRLAVGDGLMYLLISEKSYKFL